MQTVLLGTEGNQPFKINNKGVSRRHAEITISDDGSRWTLQDMKSANGTFVRREEDGTLVRVGKIDITPMTFICLGPDTAHGCSFYARQVLSQNYGKFDDEYMYLTRMNELFNEKLAKVDKKVKILKIIGLLVNVVLILASFFLPQQNSLWLLRGGTIITTSMTMLYDGAANKRKIEKERERFFHCPNPCCNHKLRPADIENYQCPRCKKP